MFHAIKRLFQDPLKNLEEDAKRFGYTGIQVNSEKNYIILVDKVRKVFFSPVFTDRDVIVPFGTIIPEENKKYLKKTQKIEIETEIEAVESF